MAPVVMPAFLFGQWQHFALCSGGDRALWLECRTKVLFGYVTT